MKLLGIIGWKNSGKTSLMERLVREFSCRNLRVSTIKHAHHSFTIDKSGTDSDRHRKAGAYETLLVSGGRWALMHEGQQKSSLDSLLVKLEPVDLVLIEGFKTLQHRKIETRRREAAGPPIAASDRTVVAVASDQPECDDLPVFKLDATSEIAAFILEQCGLRPRDGHC